MHYLHYWNKRPIGKQAGDRALCGHVAHMLAEGEVAPPAPTQKCPECLEVLRQFGNAARAIAPSTDPVCKS
jgi:hypothetical protein